MIQQRQITIGIITYDRHELLKQAVQSVISQSFNNFELLIGNDNPAIKINYEMLDIDDDPRIKIINHNQNLGEEKNMNYLLKIASGEWFSWLADDDLLHPDCLNLLYKCVKADSDVPIVGAYSNFSHGHSPEGIFPQESASVNNRVFSSRSFILEYTSKKCNLIGCYGLMKTDILKKINGILSLGSGFGPYSDTLIPILLTEYGQISWIDIPLVFLRTHSESLSIKSSDFSAYISAETEFLNQLKRVCSDNSLINIQDASISNMLIWFAADELCVLSRNSTLGSYKIIKKYLNQQFSVNINRVPNRYKMKYIFVIFHQIFSYLFTEFIRQFIYPLRNSLRSKNI